MRGGDRPTFGMGVRTVRRSDEHHVRTPPQPADDLECYTNFKGALPHVRQAEVARSVVSVWFAPFAGTLPTASGPRVKSSCPARSFRTGFHSFRGMSTAGLTRAGIEQRYERTSEAGKQAERFEWLIMGHGARSSLMLECFQRVKERLFLKDG